MNLSALAPCQPRHGLQAPAQPTGQFQSQDKPGFGAAMRSYDCSEVGQHPQVKGEVRSMLPPQPPPPRLAQWCGPINLAVPRPPHPHSRQGLRCHHRPDHLMTRWPRFSSSSIFNSNSIFNNRNYRNSNYNGSIKNR